jgi:tetratricopeptide (TPR) repeat protein
LRGFIKIFFSFFLSGLLISTCAAQTGKTGASTATDSAITRGVALATAGKCPEALTVLTNQWEKTASRDLRLRAGISTVRCAIKLDQLNLAEGVLYRLNRDYPVDPDVLFLSVHAYSDLSARSSQILATSAPDSLQARELYAEALETQQQWDDAVAVYKKLLVSFPNEPGIHFRLGRILLSRPNPPADVAEQAKKEFEAELAIDPKNAAAEFVLGELARQAQQSDEAIRHFTRATELDAGFADAFVSLGSALVSDGKYAEAVAPLEKAVKLQPQNPIAHFALANALNRSGKREEAQREFAIHRQLTQKHDANAMPAPQTQTPE